MGCQRKSTDEAIAFLGIDLHTVKTHLKLSYSVLGMSNRTEAAVKVQAVLRGPTSEHIT